MFKFVLKTPDIKKFAQMADEKHRQIEDAVGLAIIEAQRISRENYLSQRGPTTLGVKTGNLRASVRAILQRGNPIVGILGVLRDLIYARILHDGGKTRPHEILPRNKKALRFASYAGTHPVEAYGRASVLRYGRGGKLLRRQVEGAVTFAKRVMHPGSKFPPRPYLKQPLMQVMPGLKARINQIMRGVK
jgi:hypothetical protein